MDGSSSLDCELPRKSTSPCSPFAAPTKSAVQNHIGCAACGARARQTKPVPLATPHRSQVNVRTAASADPLPQLHERSPGAWNRRQMLQRYVPAPIAPASFVATGPIPPSESHIACHSLPVFELSKTVANSAPAKRRPKPDERFCRPNKSNPFSVEPRKKESSILQPVFHAHPNLDQPESQSGPQSLDASDPRMPTRPPSAPTLAIAL